MVEEHDKYCDRTLYLMRWKYCLVTTYDDYYHECLQLGVKRDEWGTPTAGSAACCTFFMPPHTDEKVCIVAILNWEEKSGIEIAGLLVHEAMHIWQREMRDIGEGTPSDEFGAYAVQSIATALMEQFWKQVVWPIEKGNHEQWRNARAI